MSVVVPTYSFERIALLRKCVDSLIRQSYRQIEIMVVVDGNEDLASCLKRIFPQNVLVLLSSQRGLSEVRNTGAIHATGEIIAQIDDDAMADEDWIASLVRDYEDPHVLVVGGRVDPIWPGYRPKWISENLYWIIGCSYTGLPVTKSEVRNVFGGNMSFRKEIFHVTKFKSTLGRTISDRRALSCDETEFCINLLRVLPKAKIIYDPEAIVRHHVSSERLSLVYFLKRGFYEGVSKAIISQQYGVASLSRERSYFEMLLRGYFRWNLRPAHFKDLRPTLFQFFLLLTVSCTTVLGFILGQARQR